MLKYLLLLAILPIILVSIYSQESYSQLSDVAIIVTTDKISYSEGETIVITGEVRDLYSGTPVSVIIANPNNHLVSIMHVNIDTDKKFHTEMTTGGELMKLFGTYIITTQYKTDTETISDNISFQYGSFSSSNYSQPNHITITTNQSTYHEGNPIYISGNFNNSHNGTSMSISLQSPNGHLSPIHNIISENNNYSTTIPTGNNTTIHIPGLYTLTAHYGNNTASTTFDYYLNSSDTSEEYFIPEESYLTLSDRDITKWTGELLKWQNAQIRTDNQTEFYYEKLDEAITNNQTNRINLFTEKIGYSIALSSLYDGIIECLIEELELLS